MVSLTQRNAFIDDIRDDPSGRFAFALVFQEPISETGEAIRERVAASVIRGDRHGFENHVKELELRKIRADSDWIYDDFFIFTLIVGVVKFGIGRDLCSSVLGARRPSNDIDVAIHAAFLQLLHGAYTIEGKLAFIKLVFSEIIGKLDLNSRVVATVYAELIDSERVDSLAVFPRLLAYRAFDILVLRGVQQRIGSVDDIVSAIRSRSKKLSLAEWSRIVFALRPSTIWAMLLFAIGICSACFGAGIWVSKVARTTEQNSGSNNAMPQSTPTSSAPHVEKPRE